MNDTTTTPRCPECGDTRGLPHQAGCSKAPPRPSWPELRDHERDVVSFPFVTYVRSRSQSRVDYLVTIYSPSGPCVCACEGWRWRRECRHVAGVLRELTERIEAGALVLDVNGERCTCGGQRREHHHGVCSHCDAFAGFTEDVIPEARHEFRLAVSA